MYYFLSYVIERLQMRFHMFLHAYHDDLIEKVFPTSMFERLFLALGIWFWVDRDRV